MKQKILQVMVAVLACASVRAQINTGSNGSDGAFNPTVNTVINMASNPNGIYQYTSVNIPTNVTVTFIPNANNTPVYWLVQSNVVINGIVNVSGQNANGAAGGLGGPGGWAGGNGANGSSSATSGFGPGGGAAGYNPTSTNYVFGGQASFGTLGSQTGPSSFGYLGQAAPGVIYGNNFLIPLIGGSGGGGSSLFSVGGGGGGGGAVLIAANGNINVMGNVSANGGSGTWYVGYWTGTGAGGSGGAIRMVAALISGGGIIAANGGVGFAGYSGNQLNDNAGNGRIRFDTYQDNFSGNVSAAFTQGSQFIIIPSSGQLPQLTVTSIGGVAVSASPTGVLSTPDAVLSAQQNNPIPIVVSCANLPLNTQITVSVRPAKGSPVSATGYNTTGTLAASTATISIVIPRGGGLIYATAATGN